MAIPGTIQGPWHTLADEVLEGTDITREQARAILDVPHHKGPAILDAGFRIRSHYWKKSVNIHILNNAKSGRCPENCTFCSQAIGANTDIPEYPVQDAQTIIEKGRTAVERGADTYCIVMAVRTPSVKEMDAVTYALRTLRSEFQDLTLCCSLGFLNDAQIHALAASGANRINHNLETSRRFFPSICTTHTYDDRIDTIRRAKTADLEICSGGIIGMGESRDDVVDLAFALRKLGVHSVPINFLDSRKGTLLEKQQELTPWYCLMVLVMFRFVHPDTDIRVAGGREANLRTLQPMALYVASSIFTSGYLTTSGNLPNEDIQMILDMGFEPKPYRNI